MMPKAVKTAVLFIQKILTAVSLSFIYFLGFGIIFLLYLIFKREAIFGQQKNRYSFWNRAADYEMGVDESARQS